ncbi:Metallo-dependent phosphatase [Xylariaceae sp. AK1471]|nr:Metallo-dependent phosphatase [Xylariaceae sp. AK1471]
MSLLKQGILNLFLFTLDTFRGSVSKVSISLDRSTGACSTARCVVTDLSISFSTPTDPASNCPIDPPKWHCIEKNLYLNSLKRSAWLQVAWTEEKQLTVKDLVITDIRISDQYPSTSPDGSWESRPGGIWVLRDHYAGRYDQVVTAVDVLFGADAIDPRPHWALLHQPFLLDIRPEGPVPRLTVRHGSAKPSPDHTRTTLRVREDGKFKIVQISDTHMVTGVGVCKDAMDAGGQPLPESHADPLTVNFVGDVLDVEKPDLVVLTGDQLHHDILDSQSTLFKVVAPLIQRSIPFAAVFGNHDDEGSYALSRATQMSLLKSLPYSLSQSGPEEVDGEGNYYLQVFGNAPSELSLSTLFFLDSHGQLSNRPPFLGYDWIKQSQIDWFTNTSQVLRKERENDKNQNLSHLYLTFQHIPLPEYGDGELIIRGGHRGEPTEGPNHNSNFYNALVKEGIMAIGCGHDHVNDFCALKPRRSQIGFQRDSPQSLQLGPWLCYGGGSGFGGYGMYGEKRYYRRARVWELDTNTGRIITWKRVEYAGKRMDELLLVDAGAVVAPDASGVTTQAPL